MDVKLTIKTAEEFLKTDKIKVWKDRFFVERECRVSFTEKMWELIGKTMEGSLYLDKNICKVVLSDGTIVLVEPWMCSKWLVVRQDFEYYELVEVRDYDDEDWVPRHFLGYDEEDEECSIKTTRVSREIYERSSIEERELSLNMFYRQIRKIER